MADPPEEATTTNEVAEVDELQRVQEESEKQGLPEQEKVFHVARRIRSRLTHLPDVSRVPLGFVPGRGYDVVFPFVRLPELRPTLNGDWVQFGSSELVPNLLYYGDNLQVLRTLPTECVDLIYIDPPFFSGAEYNVIWGDANEVRTFNDIWDGGLDTYVIWLNARLWEMRRVLKSTGFIFVHADWHAAHYIKSELDKIFGYQNFVNSIAWCYSGGGRGKRSFARKHDEILVYAKSQQADLNVENVRIAHSKTSGWANVGGEFKRGRRYDALREGKIPEDWWLIPQVNHTSAEYVGYPTQKPVELMQRIIESASPPGGIVADFFCGGGSFVAAAAGLRAKRTTRLRQSRDGECEEVSTFSYELSGTPRRFIASDISRVAVSVTLNRLVEICEEQSGVKSNYARPGIADFQPKLPQVRAKVPDIRVVYVGVYPMDRFKAVDLADFERFVLQCFGCRVDTSDEPISGWRTQLEPVIVGPADPDTPPDPASVKAFFEACLTHLQPNTKMRARVLAWKFSPQLIEYRRQLLAYIDKNLKPRGVPMELDYVPINSQQFRERIIRKYPEASDNEFFLRFTQPPIIGDIKVRKTGAHRYRFEALDTYSTNLDGYLVNCQWDFDYQRGHFAAHPEYILGRRELKGKEAKETGRKFEAVLVAEHGFDNRGRYTIACRVQDNLGGEAIKPIEVNVED